MRGAALLGSLPLLPQFVDPFYLQSWVLGIEIGLALFIGPLVLLTQVWCGMVGTIRGCAAACGA